MTLTERENFHRAASFGGPAWIPTTYMDFYRATWDKYGEQLTELVRRHPRVYVDYHSGTLDLEAAMEGGDEPYHPPAGTSARDSWGCVWYTPVGGSGLLGYVTEHPLADWAALEGYEPPDPARYSDWGERDWDAIERSVITTREKGAVTWGDAGSLFDRLYYLRGFENLMMDFATDAPQLPELVDLVTRNKAQVVERWLEIGVDAIYFHTDIGFKDNLMIRPKQFRRHIKPMYQTLFTPCREQGTEVYLSSEGYLLDIVDDLVGCGVTIQDAEVASSSIDAIAESYKGKLCVIFYPDAQKMPFWSPEEVRAHIEEAVVKLGSPQGGLMIASYPTPDVPLENIEAMAEAIEEFRTYWSNGGDDDKIRTR